MKQTNEKRWKIAQESEKEYWMQWETKELLKYLEKKYQEKLKELLSSWDEYLNFNKNLRILQIGCGPLDIINYFDTGELHSADPLADFYKQRFKGIDYKKTNLKQASGEKLPYPKEYFDLVIINNVLDHTSNPLIVIKEAKRVLKKDGIIHLEVQVYQRTFLIASKIWAPFKKFFTGKVFNIHHPYMFHAKDIEQLILKEFNIIKKELEDLDKLKNERKKQRFTLRAAAKIGILGNINYKFLCVKKNGI